MSGTWRLRQPQHPLKIPNTHPAMSAEKKEKKAAVSA
jgi:hypothetical protein